jgi:hypothetical protein
MNTLMEQQSDLLKSTQELRNNLMNVLVDEDLALSLPGANPSLGALCREMGEIEQSYIDSFKQFKQDFSYSHDPSVETSVEKLKAWYTALDAELESALGKLSNDDLEKTIDRGHGFAPTVVMQFHIYRESLLIFYAKLDVYIKALGKTVPGQWQWWIGNKADYMQL